MKSKLKHSIVYKIKEGRWPLLFSIFVLLFSSYSFAQPLKKIVSINLCTDQYLIALADKEQVLALSPFAKDENLSFFAKEAKDYATIRDDAESVLQLKPDIVVASSFNNPNTLKLLRNNGIEVVTIGFLTKLEELKKHIDHIGNAIGRQAIAEEWQNRLNAVLNDTNNIHKHTSNTALYYQRGGYISGKNSLFGMMLDHVGLINQATQQNRPTFGSMSLESLISNPPDILILSAYGKNNEDQGNQQLRHPAMLKMFSQKKIVRFPTSETVCSGPGTIAALKRLRGIKKRF